MCHLLLPSDSRHSLKCRECGRQWVTAESFFSYHLQPKVGAHQSHTPTWVSRTARIQWLADEGYEGLNFLPRFGMTLRCSLRSRILCKTGWDLCYHCSASPSSQSCLPQPPTGMALRILLRTLPHTDIHLRACFLGSLISDRTISRLLFLI